MFSLYRGNEFIKGGTMGDLKSFIKDTESKPKEYIGQFYCLPHCTECCHQNIGVNEVELFRIKRALRKMDPNEIERLKGQERNPEHCPLLDVENKTCSVYEVRPDICKAFGTCTGALACSYNLDAKLDSVHDYFANMIHSNTLPMVGKLGVDYTWKKGLVRI